MTPTAKHEMKKREILEKGMEVMYLKGYNATGVQDLADAAGIPKGSVYNYFKSKEEFVVEAIAFFSSLYQQEVRETLTNESLTPLNRLKNLFQSRIDYCKEEQKCKMGCFIGNLSQELGDVNERVAEVLKVHIGENLKPYTSCLREAQEGGEIPSHLDVDKISESIFYGWQGAMLQMKVERSARPMELFFQTVFEVILKK